MNIPEVIVTHANTDFDGFAATVAAAKLYPEAKICFPGSLNRNVREFYNLHADEIDTVDVSMVDRDKVRRLIIVDTIHCGRLGEFENICPSPQVEVIVFDHHRLGAVSEKPAFVADENYVLARDGSLVTTMLKIIHDRKMEISPLEATIFALGIHEDTGSLTFPTTTPRDAEALALCMRLGANQSLIGKYLHNPLTGEQRQLMLELIDELDQTTVGDVEVFIAAVKSPVYVEGLSVVAHKMLDVTDCQALIVMVEMENRIFVVGRSKTRLLDVARALAPVGGGGHSQAASAIVKDRTLDQTRRTIVENLPMVLEEPLRARDIMSHPVYFVEAHTTIGEALLICQRYGHSGVSVRDNGMLVGIVSRKDLDKAVGHKLKHAPVKGIMSRGVRTVSEDTTVHELRRLMAESAIGRIPVVTAAFAGRSEVPVDEVRGIVTRTDVLRTLHGAAVEEGVDEAALREVDLRERLAEMPGLSSVLAAVQKLSTEYRGVYLVGGFVRDAILGEPNYDIDIAVEGDGIEFAGHLAQELGGRVRAHEKFHTAVVILDQVKPELRVDVATTRTEFYDYPAALPTVEHASIKHDLYRRDFTINAMAVSLSAHDFGRLLDFFGGLADIENKVIRVLHNLSFIEDPTRIFRAIRYENRLGFRMNSHTLGLARGCVEMNLVGDLSSARLRDELVWLLSEPKVEHTIKRIGELGIAPSIHPQLAADAETAELVSRADSAVRELHMSDEIRRWRLRLVCMARKLEPEQLASWTERLKLRGSDAAVIAAGVVLARKVNERLASAELARPALYELLARLPAEGLLLAWAEAGEERSRRALELYLKELRYTALSIGGKDLLELGLGESPEVGQVLTQVKLLKLEGKVDGREEELKAAGQIINRINKKKVGS
ncbi:MAG: CBS domain-containing protein [Actinobacteria bacterium]|nr:CBS domain-containing protein [Actinomycetota bacterium]